MTSDLCQHCQRRRLYRALPWCDTCRRDPAIRRLHASHRQRRADPEAPVRLAKLPLLAERANLGLPLFNGDDGR